jgi:2-keto-4-pentenoate hydratase/2-oxohepta-3-ene-1,7-dioic acid hydratase in catechol pathway
VRLVTYRAEGVSRAAFAVNGAVVDAQVAADAAGLDPELTPAVRSVRGLLSLVGPRLPELASTAEALAAAGQGLEDPPLTAPIPDPEKILCVGLNYRLHAEEFGADAPEAPNIFAKFANSLIGPRDTIGIPSVTNEVDFEGELAVVLARSCRNVNPEDALAYVAGAMVFNDVTARDLQRRTSQWTAGKAIDTFAPCGPAIVSLDEVGELGQLQLRTTVNGTLMQDASISEMIHSVPETIAFLSRFMTLRPGDVIATGTPHGVGFRRDPPVFLRPGDVVEVEIDRLGSVINRVSAEHVGNESNGAPERAPIHTN